MRNATVRDCSSIGGAWELERKFVNASRSSPASGGSANFGRRRTYTANLTGARAEEVLRDAGRMLSVARPVLQGVAVEELSVVVVGVSATASSVTVLGNFPSCFVAANALGANVFNIGGLSTLIGD